MGLQSKINNDPLYGNDIENFKRVDVTGMMEQQAT